jgi:hypothetical protein
MDVQRNLTSIMSVLSIVFAVVGLVFNPASAAMPNPHSVDGSGTAKHGYSIYGIVNRTLQGERLQTMLTKLSHQGVNVSQAQADLTTGNMTVAFQWLHEYLEANPGALVNATGRQSGKSTAWKSASRFAGYRPSAGSLSGQPGVALTPYMEYRSNNQRGSTSPLLYTGKAISPEG